MQKFVGKIVLITGATSGLGSALAHRFAQEGAHLILLGRDTEKLEALDDALSSYADSDITLVPVDLKDIQRLQNLGVSLTPKYPHIDIVIGNAGMLGALTPMPHQDPNVWQEVLDVNLTANFHLIKALDPLVKNSTHPRWIFVTSGVASKGLPYWGAYGVSKAALEEMVKIYAHEMESSPTRVNLVDPGMMATKLLKQAMPGKDLSQIPAPETMTDVFVHLASEECQETGQLFKARDFAQAS